MENHYQDEARHMSCSKLFGKQAIKETKLSIINFFAIILYSKYMTHVSSFGAPYKNTPTKNKFARIGMLRLCGVKKEEAIQLVRSRRKGAIETKEQEEFIFSYRP